MANSLAVLVSDTAADVRAKLAVGDKRTVAVLALALFCAVSPLDITQLVFVLVGAAAYALLQPLEVPKRASKSTSCPKSAQAAKLAKYVPPAMRAGARPPSPPASAGDARSQQRSLTRPPGVVRGTPSTALIAKASAQPVLAPTFKAATWDAQVDELVISLIPTVASEKAVERLARRVQCVIRGIVPEAEVVGFASGALSRGRAFGVAVPDVDIVVGCGPMALTSRLLGGRASRPGGGQRAEGRQLQKVALRAFTDRLVGSGDFKFRRSAFGADEPKVTLLADGASGGCDGPDSIPIDLAINSATPLHNAALVTECARFDRRARALILFVRRWARDRGICHIAKGHLSPYCWTLLAIFFLQAADDEQMLPPLDKFKASARLAGEKPSAGEAPVEPAAKPTSTEKSVGTLFREFVAFYNSSFDVRAEAVSVRLGRRAPPSLKLPLHVALHEDGAGSEVALNIEDPFDQTRNLAAGMSASGIVRFREEFARASTLLAEGAPLSGLLEPWVPEGGASSPGSTGSEKDAEAE